MLNAISTGTIAGVALAAAVVCGWRGARPARALGAPRLVPWRFLMLLFATVVIAMLVHLVTLTSERLKGDQPPAANAFINR